MVKIFVVGCSSVGKTTLISKLWRNDALPKSSSKKIYEVARSVMKKRDISGQQLRANANLFWKFQCWVIEEQLLQENANAGVQHVIFDRCFLDAVVFGLWLYKENFPNYSEWDIEEEKQMYIDCEKFMSDVFSPFCSDSLRMVTMKDAVNRYRKSLLVLVHPWTGQKATEDDGIRNLMNINDMILYNKIYKWLLLRLKVPYLDLVQSDIPLRVEVVTDAIKNGKQNLPFASLELYEKLSNKKHSQDSLLILENACNNLNLPFYIDTECKKKDSFLSLPMISISEHNVEQTWTSLDAGKLNRIVDTHAISNIFMIDFHVFVKPVVVEVMLKDGILICGEKYSFLGCSSSGLKIRKCYLWRGTNLDAEKIRRNSGAFHKLKTVSKRIARFSLLLSNVQKTSVLLEEENVLKENDIEYNGYNFTDGCGGISVSLAKQVFKDVYMQERKVERAKYTHLPTNLTKIYEDRNSIHMAYPQTQCPSVFQIRHQGYKGVLALDSTLGNSSQQAIQEDVKVRPSMLKFDTNKFPYICVCDYSKPYTFGHLNRQFIRLFSCLGVPDEVFLTKQADHFSRVMNMMTNIEDAVILLQWNNQFHVAQRLLWYQKQLELKVNDCDGVRIEDVELDLNKRLKNLQQKLLLGSEKLRILIPKSRTLFGICEPTNRCGSQSTILKYGQCFLRVTINGKPNTVTGQVVVSKNPCYLPGDVRVLKAISCPELEKGNLLVDCLVFPVEGEKPHSAEIAGSDLDGDNFFVCWDEDLIPRRLEEPYSYPAYEPPQKKKPTPTHASIDENENVLSDVHEMVKYVSIQNVTSMKTGKINNLYESWADRKGANSSECRRLGQLFSRVVDSAKSGEHIIISQSLKCSGEQPCVDKFVWQKLKTKADEFRKAFNKHQLKFLSELSGEFLEDLVSDSFSNLREFTKFRLVMDFLEKRTCSLDYSNDNKNYYETNNTLFEQYFESPFAAKINFGLFTPSEKSFTIQEYKFPVNFVMNALSWKSNLLSSTRIFHEFTQKFQLDNENIFPWQLYFQWQVGDVCKENIWQWLIFRAVNLYSNVLITIQVPNDVCFIIRFCRDPKQEIPITNENMKEIDLNISNIHATCYFYSPRFGYSLAYNLNEKDSNFKMDFADNVLQIYRGVKMRTFIQFKMKEPLPCVISKRRKCKKSSNRKKNDDNEDSDSEENHMHSISVDLTRFRSNILTDEKKGRHPLVRKTPVISVETFVFNRRSNFSMKSVTASYVDVSQGNFLPDLNEQIQFENDSSSDDENDEDVSKLAAFEKLLQSHSICQSVDSLLPKEDIDPNVAMNFLEGLNIEFQGKALPNFIQIRISELLIRIISKMVDNVSALVKVFSLICGLGFIDTANEVLDTIIALRESSESPCKFNSDALFKFTSDWKLLVTKFFPHSSFVKRLLDFIMNEHNAAMIEDSPLEIVNGVLPQFFKRNYAMHGMKREYEGLIHEFQNNKDRLKPTKGCYNNNSKELPLSIDTPETIGNLIIEADSSSEKPTTNEECVSSKVKEISFYRLTSLPFKIRHWTGQYVCLTKQIRTNKKKVESMNPSETTGDANPILWGENDFPALTDNKPNEKRNMSCANVSKLDENLQYKNHQETVLCLARVKKLQEAPFSITVDVVSGSDQFKSKNVALYPRCVQQCIDTNRKIKWRLSLVLGNVVTFSRVLDALKIISLHIPQNNNNNVTSQTNEEQNSSNRDEYATDGDTSKGQNSSNRDEYATDEDASKGQNSSNRDEYATDEDTSKGQNSSNRDECAAEEDTSKGQNSSNRDEYATEEDTSKGQNSSNRDEYATEEDTSKGQNSSNRGEYATDEDTSKGQNSSNRDESATDEAPSKVVYQKQFDEELLPFILLPSMPKEHIQDRKYLNNIISFCDYSGSDLLCTQLYDRLNTSQQHAVDNARKYRVSLVHGPPGTGKTTTACAIVCDIKKNFDYKKILVCAETNLAVDNLAIKFVDSFPKDEGINLLRINSRQDRQELRNPNAQSNLKVQEISLEHKLMIRMGDHSNTRMYPSSKEKKEAKKIISEANIVFTTCAGAGDPQLDHQHFQFVLIDEATMTKESTSLCALMHGCQHLTLIGDPNQLGPSNSGVDEEDAIPETLFHKFHQLPQVFKITFLNVQHRMHPVLAAFPSREFYENNLSSAEGLSLQRCFSVDMTLIKSYKTEAPLKWWPMVEGRTRLSPICFVDVCDGSEQRIGTSYNNIKEADLLIKVWLDLLLSGAVSSYQEIAILTLYKGQVLKLREQFINLLKDIQNLYPLAEIDFPSSLPEINSVDSYQGRENEVVLVTTVRSDNILGFSGDKNRINVLLTRAKRALCVVGSKKTLMISPVWAKWLADVPGVCGSDINRSTK